jgi:hypothetical protein
MIGFEVVYESKYSGLSSSGAGNLIFRESKEAQWANFMRIVVSDIRKDNFKTYRVFINKSVYSGSLDNPYYLDYIDKPLEIFTLKEFLNYWTPDIRAMVSDILSPSLIHKTSINVNEK